MGTNLFAVDERGAVLSSCARYRYHLWRCWAAPGEDLRPMGFVMLNPSTADASIDDPTIRRCTAFARREGCNALNVANLFAWRSTAPAELRDVDDPVGPENHRWLESLLDVHSVIGTPLVAAWGVSGPKVLTARESLRFVDRARARGVALSCFGATAIGWPRHPLYVRGAAPLVEFPRMAIAKAVGR